MPSGQLERALGFGSLGLTLMLDRGRQAVRARTGGGGGGGGDGGDGGSGAAGAGGSSGGGSSSSSSSPISPISPISDTGAEALAATLCRMRGAALKLGQMLSIQDEDLLPAPLVKALRDVRTGANVMPAAQLHGQLDAELGEGWRERLGVASFTEVPLAAASIGQVHRASVRADDADGADDAGDAAAPLEEVVLKVQYPGVATGIESDLTNLSWLISSTGLAPKGLFIENIISVARRELAEECDYVTEAAHQARYAALLRDAGMEGDFIVPRVYPRLSSRAVLATEFVDGVQFESLLGMDQQTRNRAARRLLRLTVKELFEWNFMQTDPNWGNYLYDPATDRIVLLDFGACQAYPRAFTEQYFGIVAAAANENTPQLLDMSEQLGFLTGEENEEMRTAHIRAGLLVGEPFQAGGDFNFAQSNLTARLGEHAKAFMKNRLTPPPTEIYSLHRKLAGAFLACIKLRAVIPCRDLLEEAAEHMPPSAWQVAKPP